MSPYPTVSMVDTDHQMPENAFLNTSGCASCSRLYIHRLDPSISVAMMNTEDRSCCFLLAMTSVMTFRES